MKGAGQLLRASLLMKAGWLLCLGLALGEPMRPAQAQPAPPESVSQSLTTGPMGTSAQSSTGTPTSTDAPAAAPADVPNDTRTQAEPATPTAMPAAVTPAAVTPAAVTPAAVTPAATGTGTGTGLRSSADPFEPFNRQVYAFNMSLDRAIMLPVARAYERYVPTIVQTGLRNAVSNLLDPYIAANNLLQGKPKEALSDLTRFALNTTVGIAGLADPATELGLEKHREDFGQTLGVWGVPPGAYMMLPVFGPSSVRDTIGFGVDIFGALVARFDQAWVRIGLGGLDLIQLRVRALPAQGLFEEALDPYLLMRDGYLQRRRSLIYDGEPPEAD